MLASLASFTSLLLLAFAVSLDGFGVGITYGVRQIRIPPKSIWVISLCSGLVILLAMLVGTLLIRWIPAQTASSIGAIILIGIGLWAIIQFMRSREADPAANRSLDNTSEFARHGTNAIRDDQAAGNPDPGQRAVWTLEIRQWGIMIQILRTPAVADMDRSGTITTGEAFLLGAALSLDAFGAGIGAAMVGFPPLLTSATIAAASGLFLWLGTRIGFHVAGWRWVKPLTVLPGIILIAMGLLKLL